MSGRELVTTTMPQSSKASPQEPYRRSIDDTPSTGINLHHPPLLIAQIDIEPITTPTDTNKDRTLGTVEVRLCLDGVKRRLHRLGSGRSSDLVEEATPQPTLEMSAADRPCLAVSIDLDIGVSLGVCAMKQSSAIGEANQQVGLALFSAAITTPATTLIGRIREATMCLGDPSRQPALKRPLGSTQAMICN